MTDSTNEQENTTSIHDLFNLVSKDIESHEFNNGETGHLLSNKWYSKFKRAAKQNNQNNFNLPIDNTHLFDENGEIKQWLIKNRDYIVVSDKTWKLLSNRFKVTGPLKEVQSVEDPIKKKPVLDVIPSSFLIHYNSENEKNSSKQVFISKYAKVSDLKIKALKEYGIYKENEASSETRLRSYLNQNGREVLDDNKPLLSYYFTFEPELLLEKKNEKGEWPQHNPENRTSLRKNSSSNSGITGIKNLGNQCFQASIIQALGHCRVFVDAIRDEKYDNFTKNIDISVFTSFRGLIKDMWNNEAKYTLNLSHLIDALIKAEGTKKIYTDMQQHDAHGYLLSLLDYLIGQTTSDPNHNEVKIVQNEDSDGSPSNDQLAADKNWNRLIEANNSPLFPLFYFLESERCECQECHSVHTNFKQNNFVEISFNSLSRKQKSIIWVPYSSTNHPHKFIIKIDSENASDQDFTSKIYSVLEKNKIDRDANQNSTIAFAYQPSLEDFGESDPFAASKEKIIASQSTAEIIALKPELVFEFKKDDQNNLYAFEIPDKTKSYFVVTFSLPTPDKFLVTSFICQFEEEESEEEAKRIAISNLKKTLFGSLFKVEDDSNQIEQKVFENVTVSGSLVQNDRYQFLYNLVVNVQIDLKYPMNTESRRFSQLKGVFEVNIVDLLRERTMCPDLFVVPNFCKKCNAYKNMNASYQFWQTPEILIIHVAPFSCVASQGVARIEKLPVKVSFPEILKLSDCMCEPRKGENIRYKLSSVVMHMGNDPSCGHYTTFAYQDKLKEWFYFNDDTIIDSNLSDVLQVDPFLLFYQRINEE